MTAIVTTDLTTKVVGGTGVFDELMDAVSAHLQSEYTKKRITGSNYSEVYLGAMQSVLSQSIQFLLQKDISDKQADLINQQISNAVSEGLLIDEQRAKLTKELETDGLLDKQVLQVGAQINQTDAQTTLLGTENTKAGSENTLILAQKSKVDSDKLVSDQQLVHLTQQTSTEIERTTLVQREQASATATTDNMLERTLGAQFTRTDLMPAQKTKLVNESALVLQKHESERAQTSDTLLDNVTAVVGNLGAQKGLFKKQTEGYDRNNEYKLTKLMVDAFNVGVGSNDGRNSATAGLADPDVKEVLDAARAKYPGFENT